MKPNKPQSISLTSSSNFSPSISNPSYLSNVPAINPNTSSTNGNTNTPSTSLPSIPTLLQHPLPPLPTTRSRTHNPITRLPAKTPESSAASVFNTSTTTRGLVTTQRTKIIKTFVLPKRDTKIVMMITITTIQEPIFDKEKNSWALRRMTEIKKIMVRRRMRGGDGGGGKNGISRMVKNTRKPGRRERDRYE